MFSDAAMITRLENEIKKLHKKIKNLNQNEDEWKLLMEKISLRELQILHPKECLITQNRRRTWAPSSSADKPILFDGFVKPDAPALLVVPSTSFGSNFINFTRGTKSNSPISEQCENSFESEIFIPGEQAFFTSNRISPTVERIITENEIHTPRSFKLNKNVLTPEIMRAGNPVVINRCGNCTFVEQELEELREFTKLEYKIDNGEVGWDLLVKKESEKIVEQMNEYKNNFEITQTR